MREKVQDDSMDLDQYNWENELLFVEMGRAILGDYREFRLGWARFEMLILHSSVDEGRFHQGTLARILDW